MTFTIRKAERKAIPALIALWGPSSSGKTLSAIKVARGLVGPKGKIGLIDTENRRAEFYANECGGWDHLDLQPAFTPDRYTEAFRHFENAGGYGCVIVDSFSHTWQGEGGVLDMADNARSKAGKELFGLAKWKGPKMAYKRMVNSLLRAPFHVIFCLRAKEGIRQTGRGDDSDIQHVGLEPICDRDFIYEQTVSILLGPDHRPLFQAIDRFRCNPMIPPVKAPAELWGTIKPGEYLSEANGQAIAEWVSGGATFDNRLELLRRTARDTATYGLVRLEAFWKTLDKGQQRALKSSMDELKDLARRADEDENPLEPRAEKDDPDPFADSFTPPKTTAGPQPEGTPVPPADVTAPQSTVTKAPTAEPPATKSEPTADELWGLSKARFPTPIRQHDEIIRKINDDAKSAADIDAILATNKALMAGIAKDMGNTAIREIEAAAAKRKKELA